MVFNSWSFAAFFIAFFALYWGTRRAVKWQNALIFVGSYFFYGCWDVRFLLLIMCCTVTDFITGLSLSGRHLTRKNITAIGAFLGSVALAVVLVSKGEAARFALWIPAYVALVSLFIAWADRLEMERRRKAYLVGSIVYNLSVLCFFKYFNFFADNLVLLLNGIGLHASPVTLSVILPVGISFFTFQSMSFSLDVYRGKLTPTDEITKFAAYISFFPQLVAGPIERAYHLLPQFDQPRSITWENIRGGVVLFIWGLYQKIVIADNIAPLADAAFKDAAHASGSMMLLGALAFTVQIYCDFCGYSNMARALAKMLGFELIINFNRPYFSRTPSEFWRRWHISLSSWLRDYLYIGLGGNRHGTLKTYRNLMLTMILGGLWHGASWTFILWGFFHGALLVVYRIVRMDDKLDALPPHDARGVSAHMLAWAVMLPLVVFGWVIFRSQNLPTLFSAVNALTHGGYGFGHSDFGAFFYYSIPLVIAEIFQRFRLGARMPARVWGFLHFNAALFVLLSLCFLSARGGQQFIYFDF